MKPALPKAPESHNMLIGMRKPVDVIWLFGLRRKGTSLLFYVDDPEGFLKAVHPADDDQPGR